MARIQAGSKSGDSNQVGATGPEKNNKAFLPGPVQSHRQWLRDETRRLIKKYIQVLLYEIKMYGIYIGMKTRTMVGKIGAMPSPWPT
jgi:hypothetical protein